MHYRLHGILNSLPSHVRFGEMQLLRAALDRTGCQVVKFGTQSTVKLDTHTRTPAHDVMQINSNLDVEPVRRQPQKCRAAPSLLLG